MTMLRSPAALLRPWGTLPSQAKDVTRSPQAAVPILLSTSRLRLFSLAGGALSKKNRQLLSLRQKQNKPTPSFTPSRKQQKIARLCAEHNVVVSARPGSGKTATAEAIVAAHPDKRVIVLTYSKRLQVETERRLKPYSRRCEVFTFHALACRLFRTVIHDDIKLAEERRTMLENGHLPCWGRESFDIIVLDEFQDCTPQLFWLVNCFIEANSAAHGRPARLVVLGDERQSIYEFRGADQRFLTFAPDLFGPTSPYPFSNVSLSQSFRLSRESVQFINDAFLGGTSYITSSKPGRRPLVLRCDLDDARPLAKRLSRLIHHYRPQNSAIVAPKTRSAPRMKENYRPLPLQQVVNALSTTHHVPIAPPIDEEASLKDKVIKGKLCVSTIHQFKGSERDLIILFGLDSSYFQYFGRNLPEDRCPNDIFVALTRAAKQIVLIHNEKTTPLPFVSIEALKASADIENMTDEDRDIAEPEKPRRKSKTGLVLPTSVGVRDMTRHIRDELVNGIVSRHLCINKISEPLAAHEQIEIEAVVPSDTSRGFHEDVSDINGLAIVAAFEHLITGRIEIFDCVTANHEKIPDVDSEEYPSWLCRKACDYEAYSSGYLPRKNQMKDHRFDWIHPEDLARARRRLQNETMGKDAVLRFEMDCREHFFHPLVTSQDPERGLGDDKRKIWICGRADIVMAPIGAAKVGTGSEKHPDTVWEIKFVSELSHEHALQACIYAYLLGTKSGRAPRIMLFNVRTGEKWEITPRNGLDGLRLTVEEALTAKYTVHERMKDEEFLEMCAGIRQEVRDLRA